jgi:TetR/AcrR family transcriptional regulator
MEEIGARARVNKAMVYYYYSSKKNLFREALVVTLRRIFGRIFAAFDRGLERGTDPRRKIEAAVSAHFDAFSRNPHGARLFFAAIADDPEDVRFALTIIRRESDVFPPEKLLSILEEGMRQGAFRKVDPKQTLISLVGMNLAYFVGGPIAKAVLDLRITNEEAFQAERKRSILDLFLNGLAAKGRPS